MRRRQQLGPLLIAALFGAAATAALLHAPTTPAPASEARPGATPPTLPHIPQGFDPPVSVRADLGSGGSVDPRAVQTVASDSQDLPPARALEAYQRAATIMDRADPSCRLSWALLAAIGGIESDHGRVDGTVLAPDGGAHPPILGPPLDGADSTARIVDTDEGSLDGDVNVDRAVGPLQLIPATWAVVAVDGDGDGIRDPQDIDDASLAAAVYLCAWHDDLATEAGRRAAVFRYNRSLSYVDRVLQTMAQYAAAMASNVVEVLVTYASPPSDDEVIAAAEQPGTLGVDPIWTSPSDLVWAASPTTVWVAEPAPVWVAEPAPTSAPTSWPTLTATPSTTPAPPIPPMPPPWPSTSPLPLPSTAVPSSEATAAPSATPSVPTRAPATEAPTARTPADPPSTSVPAGHPTSRGAPDSSDPGPRGHNTTPSPSEPPPAPDVELPAGLSVAEAEAWTTCVRASGSPAGDTEPAECLANALGLPMDDPRLAWLLDQIPGRENQ